ncbi:MAG: hypothetical protein ACLPUO_28025 [Streptosporangiaceae bacterium]
MAPNPPGGQVVTPVPGPARSPRRLGSRAVAVLALAAAVAVVVAVVHAAAPARGATSRGVDLAAGSVRAVNFQGVPGRIVITGASVRQVRLTGQLHWTGRAPAVTARLNRGTGVLTLAFRCVRASPCTENCRLVLPQRTAVTVRQPSADVVLADLAGPVSITARSDDIGATGLRSPSLTASITSGHLTGVFSVPPRRIAVTLASAQATLRLPVTACYAVTSRVTSGYVHVGVPRSATASDSVTASIDSGELELQPR